MPALALVLFDIDGTLIRKAGPHHRQALVDAIRRVTGMETTTDGVPVAGALDRDILRAMLRNAGQSDSFIEQAMPDLVHTAQSLYQCPNLRTKVCPGARMLLYRLHRRGIPAALVTGNLTRIGWTKMENAGLRPYLRFGAFAESGASRSELVSIAITHARSEKWIDGDAPIWLIGDHINDINAAKANKIRVAAVATGVLSTEELAAHSPDLVLEDLRSLKMEQLLARQ